MRTIHVDELAVRCNTGVRGPDGDESLMTSSADLNHLKGLGAEVERPNLATTPARAVLPGDGPSVPEAAGGHHMWLGPTRTRSSGSAMLGANPPSSPRPVLCPAADSRLRSAVYTSAPARIASAMLGAPRGRS